MPITRAYEEIIDFIAAGVRPEDVMAFRPSAEAKAPSPIRFTARRRAGSLPRKRRNYTTTSSWSISCGSLKPVLGCTWPMSSYVSAALRQLVAERAEYLCEYCLLYEEDTFFGCEVDHIISEKHGGPTVAENLVYA
jgi:hypothetical protein